MTTSKVMQTMSLLNSPDLMSTQKQSQGVELAFGTFLSQTAGGDSTQDLISAEGLGQSAGGDKANQRVYERESVKSGYRENAISRNEPTDAASKLPQDTKDKLQAFDKKVKEVIAEKLGISEEEVAQQMETMGLTALDLMDSSKLAGLVMELTGSEDIGGLLFNGDFQQMLGQIADLSQELALQLNLTPEELNLMQGELKPMVSDNLQQEMASAGEGMAQDAENVIQNGEEVPTEQVRDNTVLQGDAAAVQKNPQNPAEESGVQNEAMKGAVQQEENPSAETITVQGDAKGQEEETQSSTGEKASDLFKENNGNDKSESRQVHVTYQTTAQNVGQGQVVEVTQTVVQTRVDVEDILRQVSQMTRVFVNQAEFSVEMQLNPANLGKIYLQVVSREGVITAQIAAQNEAVKEALEGQVAVLKENMNQQGLKVEAIEVTIASHEFERNLEENQQNAAREQQEEEAAKTSRRNLSLNSPDEMEGAMTEEESLAAKMMSEQGNSMDITA